MREMNKKDVVEWNRLYSEKRTLQKELQYWRRQESFCGTPELATSQLLNEVIKKLKEIEAKYR